MKDLFNENGAVFSECRKYRYSLVRVWNIKQPSIMFIGLNPSTANETKNDPTIRRVIKLAFDFGYGSVYMMNLFPLVSPHPEALKEFYNTPFHDIELEKNNELLKKVAMKCDEIVFAWGNFPIAHKRALEVIEMFPGAKCLKKNKNGTPGHPLYMPSNTQLINF